MHAPTRAAAGAARAGGCYVAVVMLMLMLMDDDVCDCVCVCVLMHVRRAQGRASWRGVRVPPRVLLGDECGVGGYMYAFLRSTSRGLYVCIFRE